MKVESNLIGSEIGLEIDILLSYNGEGLEELVKDKDVCAPVYLSKRIK